MCLQIEPITSENRDACLSLSLHEEQRSFVPDVASSLAMAANYPDAHPLAIATKDGQVIGFCLYGVDENTGSWKIFRLIIDMVSQGLGYGTAATRLIMDQLQEKHGASEVLIVYNDGNAAAEHVFSRLGFKEYDRDGIKILARAVLPDPSAD